MRRADEILYDTNSIGDAIRLAQKEAYNQGVRDAAENAETKMASPENYGHNPYNDSRIVVDKESILKLLKK